MIWGYHYFWKHPYAKIVFKGSPTLQIALRYCRLPTHPIASMGRTLSLPTCTIKENKQPNVGKYTSPMDGVGTAFHKIHLSWRNNQKHKNKLLAFLPLRDSHASKLRVFFSRGPTNSRVLPLVRTSPSFPSTRYTFLASGFAKCREISPCWCHPSPDKDVSTRRRGGCLRKFPNFPNKHWGTGDKLTRKNMLVI